MMRPAVFGLLRGLPSQCSSSSSSFALLQQTAAVQWPALLQAAQAQVSSHHQQHHLHQQLRQPAASSRSFSVLAAQAQPSRQTAWHCRAAASPLQQLSQPHCLLPSLWQPQLQHQQPLLDPHAQLQQPLGQQARHFVLMPRRVRYRKAHKSLGFNETICGNTRQLAFGLYGIRALEHCRMPASTIEAVRRTLRRTIKKSAMLWIRMTPNVPVTSKPAEVRMGKGKGTLDYWAAPIRAGQIIFEFDRCSKATAMQAVAAIRAKMPIKVEFVEWN